MFNQKRKRNQFMLTTSLLVIAVVLLGFLLVRSISSLVVRVTNSDSTAVEVAQLPFDYTRDRDQYEYPAVAPFDYTRDRDQYEYPAVAPFDYTRDRDQYEYPAVALLDYTRDPQFEPLVLNSLYTQWCLDIAGNMTVDTLCITPHGSHTIFTTDENGSASIIVETNTLPSDSLFEVAIAYQSDGQSVADRMLIWFDFLPTNNAIAAVESTNMLANHHNDDTFQQQWLSVAGRGRYTVDGNQATLELVFESLVPDAEYSLWCVAITAPSDQHITERPCV